MATGSGEMKLVTFRLGRESYGVDIARVREIVEYQPITALPEANACVLGVLNLRGEVVPVIDLGRGLGLGAGPADAGRVIFVEVGDSLTGCLVDAVDQVVTVKSDMIQEPPRLAGNTKYLTGIAKLDERLIAVLDLDAALQHMLAA